MDAGCPLLLVEDDACFRQVATAALKRQGYAVQAAEGLGEARELAASQRFERALLDERLGQDSSLALVPELVAAHPGIRIVLLTGYGCISHAVQAVQAGAVNYLTKPANMAEISAALEASEALETAAQAPAPSLARVEWDHIHRVLNDCGGNITAAARSLGLHRRSLQRKLAKRPD